MITITGFIKLFWFYTTYFTIFYLNNNQYNFENKTVFYVFIFKKVLQYLSYHFFMPTIIFFRVECRFRWHRFTPLEFHPHLILIRKCEATRNSLSKTIVQSSNYKKSTVMLSQTTCAVKIYTMTTNVSSLFPQDNVYVVYSMKSSGFKDPFPFSRCIVSTVRSVSSQWQL